MADYLLGGGEPVLNVVLPVQLAVEPNPQKEESDVTLQNKHAGLDNYTLYLKH